MKKSIYLDFNATGQPRPEVIEAVTAYMKRAGNPSSIHHRGREARQAVEDAREAVAALVGCKPSEIIFNSGGTEASNQALRGIKCASIIMPTSEHDATIASAYATGADVHEVPVMENGILDMDAFKKALETAKRPVLVTVMRANNETGILQPVKEISALAHEAGAIVHTDAVQAAGKIPVNFADLGADLMSLASHKINGVTGTGALVVREGIQIDPLMVGGGQEKGWRSGTENAAGIVGFGKAAEIAKNEMDKYSKISELRDYLEAKIKTFSPKSVVFGGAVERLPNTSSITMPAVPAGTQVMAFDLDGFCVSSGAACSSGSVKTSHVLKAMGAPLEVAGCGLRISMGWQTTKEDVDAFFEAWKKLYNRTHGSA